MSPRGIAFRLSKCVVRCPNGNQHESIQELAEAISALNAEFSEAVRAGDSEGAAEITADLARSRANLAVWTNCTDELHLARGSHFC